MNVYALSGNDTIQITDLVLRDFGDGDVANLTFPNDLVAVKNGKNGNAVFNLTASGRQADLEIKVIRGSNDDRALQALLNTMLADFPSFELLDGYFVKRIGDGQGAVTFDTILLSAGVFTKIPEAKENTEGDTNTALTIYRMKFANTKRANM